MLIRAQAERKKNEDNPRIEWSAVEVSRCTMSYRESSGLKTCIQQFDYSIDNLFQRILSQDPDLSHHQTSVSCKELTRACITHHMQRAFIKTRVCQLNRSRIGVGLTCDLTQNPIASTDIGQGHDRPQL
jgi:hypothetical protein